MFQELDATDPVIRWSTRRGSSTPRRRAVLRPGGAADATARRLADGVVLRDKVVIRRAERRRRPVRDRRRMWLVWQGIGEHKGWVWIGAGIVAFGLYGVVATFQSDDNFGR